MNLRMLMLCGLAAILTWSTAAQPARAGGLGVFDMTGFHAGADLSGQAAESGTWLDQGVGLEILVGSRASRVRGRVRVMFNAVLPAEDHNQYFGIALFGMEIQLLRNLDRPFGLHVLLDLGPAFLAKQHEEFGMAGAGLGIHHDFHPRLGLFAEVSAQIRFRRWVWGGAALTVGLRVPID